MLGARAQALGGSRRPARARRRRTGRRRPAPAPAARRHDLHAQAHAQPRPCAQRLRRRARARGNHRRAAEGTVVPAGAEPHRRHPARAHRGVRPVRALLRPHRPQREPAGDDARVDGRAAASLRPAQRLAARRHLELRDVRARPAVAHLRPGHHRRRPRGSLGPRRRVARAAQRHHGRARRHRRRHRRRAPRRVAGRHHGRQRDGGVGRHPQRLRRGRVLVARGGRRAVAPLPVLDRCRPPLRARRRSCVDRRAPRAAFRADRRDLRRQRRAVRPDRRPRRDAARSFAPSCCASRVPRR